LPARSTVEAIPITVRDFRVADILLDLTLVAGHAAAEGIVSRDEERAWLLETSGKKRRGPLLRCVGDVHRDWEEG